MSRCDLGHGQGAGHAQGEPPCVDQCDEKGQLGPIGTNPDVANANTAQRKGRCVRGDRYEGAASAHRVQGIYSNDRRIDGRVNPAGNDAADGGAKATSARNKVCGPQAANQCLVGWRGDGHHSQPAQSTELGCESSKRAGCASDQ